MSGRQNPPATQSNPEIIVDEYGTPIPQYIFPLLPYYTRAEFEKRFIMSQSDSDALQKIPNSHQAIIKCSEHFVDKNNTFEINVKREHILYMIVTGDNENVKKAFKLDAKRKHADGPFYWSNTTFNTYMVIFRHATIDTVYYCENMYVLAHLDPASGELKSLLRQDRTPFFTEDPACDTKDFKEIPRTLVPSPAQKRFQDDHILDPTIPGYEGYEAWGWEDWKRYVFEGDPKLRPPKTEKQHTILIANKKLLNTGITRKPGNLIRVVVPCEMYIIILEGEKVKKVYRHLKAHPEIQKPDKGNPVHVLNGCYSSLNELQGYLTISDCELVNRHGRPIPFQRFMTKHVLDPNSWEASLVRGYGGWSGFKWNYWYRARKEKLKEKYNFVGVKHVILASETKIRETFQNPNCPISVEKDNRKLVWSWDCLFVVVIDGTKDYQVNPYSSNTRACPEFYIRVGCIEYPETDESGTEVSMRLPNHFDAVGHVRPKSLLISQAKALCVPAGINAPKEIHGFDTAKPSGTCGDLDTPQLAKSAWGKPTMQITGVQASAGQSTATGTSVPRGAPVASNQLSSFVKTEDGPPAPKKAREQAVNPIAGGQGFAGQPTVTDTSGSRGAPVASNQATSSVKTENTSLPPANAWRKPLNLNAVAGGQASTGQSIGGTVVSGGAVAPGNMRVPASTPATQDPARGPQQYQPQYQQGPSQGGTSGGQYGGSGQRGSYGQSQRGSGGQGSGTSMGGNGGYRGNSNRGGNGGYRGRGNSNRGGNPDSSYRGRGGRGRN